MTAKKKAPARKPAAKATKKPTRPRILTLRPGDALVLRTCDARLCSHGGFQWPAEGRVAAKDWAPTKECGAGLHGLLWGVGDGSLVSWAEDARWLVVRVRASECVDLTGKVKFPRGEVVYCGDRAGATALVAAHKPASVEGGIVGGTATAGDGGTATAGDRGTATAGDRGTATAGYGGTATAGDRGTATAGDRGTATAGYGGTATAGYGGTATAGVGGTATAGDGGTATAGYGGTATAGVGGTATAGDGGTATAGYGGTATAGYGGTATAGDRGTATAGYGGTATAGVGGTATAGDGGTATAGYGGTATAGVGGTISILYYDGHKWRRLCGEVDGVGLLAGKRYRIEVAGGVGRFVEVTP